MTTTSNEVNVLDDDGWDGPESTAAEIERWRRDAVLALTRRVKSQRGQVSVARDPVWAAGGAGVLSGLAVGPGRQAD